MMEFHSSVKAPVNSQTSVLRGSDILICCTSLQNRGDVQKLSSVLDAIPEVLSWTVDLEDCDKVLRIEKRKMTAEDLLSTLDSAGFDIREMPG